MYDCSTSNPYFDLCNVQQIAKVFILDYAATLPTILFNTLVLHVSSREIKHTVSLAWKHNVTFCGVHHASIKTHKTWTWCQKQSERHSFCKGST